MDITVEIGAGGNSCGAPPPAADQCDNVDGTYTLNLVAEDDVESTLAPVTDAVCYWEITQSGKSTFCGFTGLRWLLVLTDDGLGLKELLLYMEYYDGVAWQRNDSQVWTFRLLSTTTTGSPGTSDDWSPSDWFTDADCTAELTVTLDGDRNVTLGVDDYCAGLDNAVFYVN